MCQWGSIAERWLADEPRREDRSSLVGVTARAFCGLAEHSTGTGKFMAGVIASSWLSDDLLESAERGRRLKKGILAVRCDVQRERRHGAGCERDGDLLY